jgi:hypothetical protein
VPRAVLRVQQLGRRLGRQPRDAQLGQAGRGEPALALADRHDQGYSLGVQPPRGERQCRRRRAVQPVRVVDQAQQRAIVGELGEQGQHGHADQQRVSAAPGGQPPRPSQLTGPGRRQPERALERLPLRRRERPDAAERRPQQQVHPGERQLRLRLDAGAADHPDAVRGRGDVVKQRGLADTGLAADHQRAAGAGASRGQQPGHGCLLRGPAYQHVQHAT